MDRAWSGSAVGGSAASLDGGGRRRYAHLFPYRLVRTHCVCFIHLCRVLLWLHHGLAADALLETQGGVPRPWQSSQRNAAHEARQSHPSLCCWRGSVHQLDLGHPGHCGKRAVSQSATAHAMRRQVRRVRHRPALPRVGRCRACGSAAHEHMSAAAKPIWHHRLHLLMRGRHGVDVCDCSDFVGVVYYRRLPQPASRRAKRVARHTGAYLRHTDESSLTGGGDDGCTA